jgi:hypothetical protein
MLLLKHLLVAGCFALFACVAGIILYDIFLAYELERLLKRRRREPATLLGGDASVPEVSAPSLTASAGLRPRRRRIRWSEAARLSVLAALAGLLGASIVAVPDGGAGVRISQFSGVRQRALYARTHLIVPLVDRVQQFDVRDRVFSTVALAVRSDQFDALRSAGEGRIGGPEDLLLIE